MIPIEKNLQTSFSLGIPPQVDVRIAQQIVSPESLSDSLLAEKDSLEVFYWAEGIRGLSTQAVSLIKDIFEKMLAVKKDIRLNLYSLKAWDFSDKTDLSNLRESPFAETINKMHSASLRCIQSRDFFGYCANQPNEALRKEISASLPSKAWLSALSEKQKSAGVTVGKIYQNQPSMFDSLYSMDANHAYSHLQYVEAYYLIRKLVKEALDSGKTELNALFVLPNDEGKYYQDLPKDLERWMKIDFGDALNQLSSIRISFSFFAYGDSLSARPYIAKNQKDRVKDSEIPELFRFAASKTSAHILQKTAQELDVENVKSDGHFTQKPDWPRDLYHGL